MKNQSWSVYICVFVAIMVLSGCATIAPAMPTPNAPIQAGKALLRGRLLNSQGGVIANRAVHLAPIYGEGDQQAYVFDASTGIGSVTDANGAFVMVNIPPGRYVFLVVVSEGLTAALLDKAGNEKIWQLKADQLQELGDAKVNLP